MSECHLSPSEVSAGDNSLKLTYVGIRVSDIESSLKFYVDLFGLRVIGRGKMKHGGVYVLLEDKTTKEKVELNWYPEQSPFYQEYSVGEGIDHLGFVVDDVNKAYEELISKGATPAAKPWREIEGDDQSWIGFVKDPDGIWIELINH
jgi:lactoylglutathione lyase